MTTSTQNQTLRTFGADRVRLFGLPAGYRKLSAEKTMQAPPKLHPGAAVAFTIASVLAVLRFIQVVFS